MVIISSNTNVWSCAALFIAVIPCNDYQWPFIGSSEHGIVTANNYHGLLSPINTNDSTGIENVMSEALHGWG
jgi:hypothetical protein